ncbi:hypothetical protein ERO13_A07G126650v2 [Gossypium hirsutum]|uniref:Pectinesterase inhibitor domain-containing protein n=5 Tax=Gossypium TaxID=3633 RepID=A0A2P5XNT2_GOSBA|nr:putative invertase inhibitor [Gossypium hirsutum]KAB2074207.1 hypothetical protein ES319_A07G137900v1 [Gossypium barbadense]TYH10054.1 hypothetical protein ES288_A07G147300v1 [Gossypium darwinii]TYI19186.1 hypothetical protein ES332_A07G147200v1 [Gossypium tomentosum]TYJ26713.1 hypothetical protein E1A91_A07G139700v1 [Gossypium mustelinum]KAG4191941.1 hypothetical protein ERO13_A07G126650v2 [Gossypium hirsutum]
MKNFLISSLVFFYLMLVSVRSDVIQETCDKAARGDPPTIRLDFCLSAFEGNPKAKSATSVADLVEISIETSIANATSMGSLITSLLDKKSIGIFARNCLEDCSELYSLAVSNLRRGGKAFEGKDFGSANIEITAAMDAPITCEDGFKEKGLVSSLTKENKNFFQLTAIPLVFMKMVQK